MTERFVLLSPPLEEEEVFSTSSIEDILLTKYQEYPHLPIESPSIEIESATDIDYEFDTYSSHDDCVEETIFLSSSLSTSMYNFFQDIEIVTISYQEEDTWTKLQFCINNKNLPLYNIYNNFYSYVSNIEDKVSLENTCINNGDLTLLCSTHSSSHTYNSRQELLIHKTDLFSSQQQEHISFLEELHIAQQRLQEREQKELQYSAKKHSNNTLKKETNETSLIQATIPISIEYSLDNNDPSTMIALENRFILS